MDPESIKAALKHLPEEWYTPQELEPIIQKIFLDQVKKSAKAYDIEIVKEADISRLYELLAEDNQVSVSDVQELHYETAGFMAILALFEAKYPEIVADFAMTENDQRIFPADVLSKILGIPVEDATVLAQNLWGNESEDDTPIANIDVN